jgi:WD40 repeat protein
VLLWKISRPNALLRLQGHSSDVSVVQFATNEQEVYSGSLGGTVLVWDINS